MAKRPNQKPARSLPIQSFAGFDTVYAINSILTQLEMGMFRGAAVLSDSTGRDDRISGVTSTRIGALLGANLDVKASDNRPQAQKCADLLGGTEDAPGKWDRMFPPGVQAKILKAGLHLNFGVAQILWWEEDGLVWPRLKFWHSQFVRWDVSSESYKLMTYDGEIELPRLDENPEGAGEWFIWNPFGYQYAWNDGLIRSLAPMYMRRMWINRDWPRYNEVHGLPIHLAIVPGGGKNSDVDDQFVEDVANRGSEPTIKVPQSPDGSGYDVKILEAVAKTYETFKDSKTDVNTDIAVLVLGQNLTTEATGGGLGDGGAGTHNLVRIDKAKEDANFATAIYEQVLKPWARFNFGDASLAPRPAFEVEPPESHGQKTQVLKNVGDGLQSLQLAKVPVNERAMAEEYGIVLLSEKEQADREAADQKKAADAMAAQQKAVQAAPPVVAGKPVAPAADQVEGKPAQPKAALSGSPGYVVNRYDFAGLPIAVENPKGSVRTWVDKDGGATGATMMQHDYGFIDGHMGSDGEELDCYVGPDEGAADVHVVHQMRAPDFKAHDEDKLMIGWSDAGAAKAAFLAHRNDGDASFGGMSVIPLSIFKAKLKRRTGQGKIRATALAEAEAG